MNSSGIYPTEYKVLIEPKPVEERSAGGVLFADMTKDSEKYAQVEGTVITASPLAFTYATAAEWKAAGAQPPKPGDRVLYAKFAGVRVKGRDGKEYLLVNDKDLTATVKD